MKIDKTDVVIIGGGIVGCATAYYLSKQGLRVVVIERGEIASEQSSRAWGFVRQQGRHEAEVEYAATASRMWDGLASELEADLEFVRAGILVPAETEADEKRFNSSARICAEHGLSTRMISGDEIKKIIPELSGTWRAALYTKEDAHAEPRKATEAFAAAAKRNGVVVITNTPVLGIEVSDNKATGVFMADGLIKADTILCAAGIGAPELVRNLGIELPIQLIRSFVSETNATQPFTKTAMWGPYISFRPTLRGTFYIGAGYRCGGIGTEYDISPSSLRALKYFVPTYLANRKNMSLKFGKEFFVKLARQFSRSKRFTPLPEPQFNPKWISYGERQFYACFPHLVGLGIARTWSGRIDMTPDVLPIIGESKVARLFIAAGFSGHGFALGPATGKLLSELILSGRSSIDLKPFRISRFAEGDINLSPQAL